MVLVAIDQHFDAAFDAAGLFNILVEFLHEVCARIAQYFRIVRILRQSVRTYAFFRYEPNEPRIFRMTVTDEQQRDSARRVERWQETAHRVCVKGDFRWFDRMFHTVTSILAITKSRSARVRGAAFEKTDERLRRHGRGFPETRPVPSGKGAVSDL